MSILPTPSGSISNQSTLFSAPSIRLDAASRRGAYGCRTWLYFISMMIFGTQPVRATSLPAMRSIHMSARSLLQVSTPPVPVWTCIRIKSGASRESFMHANYWHKFLLDFKRRLFSQCEKLTHCFHLLILALHFSVSFGDRPLKVRIFFRFKIVTI